MLVDAASGASVAASRGTSPGHRPGPAGPRASPAAWPRRRNVGGGVGKPQRKPWENHGKARETMENHGKIMGNNGKS